MQIHTLAFLFFMQSFLSCQQVPEEMQPFAANVSSPSAKSGQTCQAKTGSSAANIIFQSTDGGMTWQDVSAGLPKGLGVGRIFADDNEVFLTSESGLFRSSTNAAAPAWEKEFSLDGAVNDIYPGQTGAYASCYGKGFSQEIQGANLWKPMHNTLPDKTVRTVLETANGTVFVGCESGIYKSTDGGNTWKQVFEGMVNSFAAAGDVLVCGSFQGMLRSTDGGEHWDWALTGTGGAYNTKRIGDRFFTLTDGDRPWNDPPAEGMINRLYTSADNGLTWQRMDDVFSQTPLIFNTCGSQAAPRNVNDIEQAGEYLFCSLDTGIFRSSDGGKNWQLVRPSNGKTMINLAVSGKVIYAVSVVGC